MRFQRASTAFKNLRPRKIYPREGRIPFKVGGFSLGQSSVEYALVMAAFVSLIVGLGALTHLFADGLVLDHAVQSASHCLTGIASGVWADIFVY